MSTESHPDHAPVAAPASPGAWRRLLACSAIAGWAAIPAPAQAAGMTVPGTRCLYENFNPRSPELSLVCSDADLLAWLAKRNLALTDLLPVPATLPDGMLAQGLYATAGGERVLLARYVGDRFIAPASRSADEIRAAYQATLGISADVARAPGNFVPGDNFCESGEEFAVAGYAMTTYSGPSFLLRHCNPNPLGRYFGRRILYHEGHTHIELSDGIDTVRWLAQLGFEVFAAEMPLFGRNTPDPEDPPPPVLAHEEYAEFERAPVSPLWSEMLEPVANFAAEIREGAGGSLGIIGRSGGGMTAYSIGLALPAIDYVISIAGGTPLSMRLSAPAGPLEISDWEQWSPRTYEEVGHEEMMRYGGRLGGLHIYGGLDPCCFRVLPGDGFYEWMSDPPGDGRIVEIFVDPNNEQHGLSELGRPVITNFLDRIFASPPLTVSVIGADGGRVVSAPEGIDCGTICTTQFVSGQVVDLTVRVAPGFEFTGWRGACTGTGSCQVAMNEPRQVTATFVATRFALAVTRAGNGEGTVVSTPPGIDCGTTCMADFLLGATVALTATGDAQSTFASWAGACTGTGPCIVTMEAAREVTATFTRPLYALSVTPIGDGAGVVSSNPAGLACGTTCSAPFTAGTPVVLSATPGPESIFLGWGGACASTGPCVVTMDAAKSVTAAFGRTSGIARLRNISTRMQVQQGDNSLIGGFVIGGTQAKMVIVRARGPSLEPLGVVNSLADPQLQLYSGQTVIGSNDDWGQAADADAIEALGFAPSDARESAILATLSPGAYTAIVTGVAGTTGIGIVEVFEVDSPSSALVNISTRGRSSSGENVMIGGFVIQGDEPLTVIVRARGPSLAAFGVADPIVNPTLILFAGQDFVASNEDWGESPDAARIQSLGFAPANPYESAILVTLPPGAYTAMVSDALGRPGVGIVEVFRP